MLDPRIYRTGLLGVAMALIVFAFSLQDQPAALGGAPAPTFSGGGALSTLSTLASAHPQREPGSPGDNAVADYVAGRLAGYGFAVSRSAFTTRTAVGTRTLQNVTGVLAGNSSSAIVLVAPRDALRAPDAGALSGTAALLELARVLSGETEQHTIVLASVSGSAGGAGLRALARGLARPLDGVIVLGDLAGPQPVQPLMVPWSDRGSRTPAVLTHTLANALRVQAGLRNAESGVAGQVFRLAFPMALSPQAPLLDAGAPAVLLTLAGERRPAPIDLSDSAQAAAVAGRLGGVGNAVLATVGALDKGSPVPAPSAYLLIQGKVIPAWSIRLLVLALIAPVLMTAVDGLARVRRRRHHELTPWLAWTLAGAVGFLLAAAVVAVARVAGLLSGAPGGPVAGGVAAPHGGAIATLVLAALALALGVTWLRARLSRWAGTPRLRGEGIEPHPGAGVVMCAVLCVVTLAIWVGSPLAALLLVPALHLWLWMGTGEVPTPRPVKLVLAVAGLLAPVGAIVYYGLALRLGAPDVLWNGVLMVAGGQIGTTTAILWSVVFGCIVSAVVLAFAPVAGTREQEVTVTVRGPVSYAGPGSLGGTESALRR